jgi:hypothetical protein
MKAAPFMGGILLSSWVAAGPTNEWIKPTSGYWEEPYWSLGRLPAMDQSLVALRNPGFKALVIGSSTTESFSNSLSINSLRVEAPARSLNQLLLNYAGLSVPLSVNSDFIVGTNGSLVAYYSALRGGNLYLSGPATLSARSTIQFSKIDVGAAAPAQLNLTNTLLSADLLILSDQAAGILAQYGGTNQVSRLQMNAASVYSLTAGTLNADNVDLQSISGAGLAQFAMADGYMNVNGHIKLGQPLIVTNAQGEFQLFSGYLRAAELDFINGTWTQAGGTNVVQKLALPFLEYSHGDYSLLAGALLSSNVALGAVLSPGSLLTPSAFEQAGGVHSNSNMQLYGEIRRQTVTPFGAYLLNSGLLVSSATTLIGGAFTQNGGTNRTQELVVDQAGSFVLNNGALTTSNTTVETCCCVPSHFVQNGGSYSIQNRLLLQDFVQYELHEGTLTASNIELAPSAEFLVQGGTISNSGRLVLRGGNVRVAGRNLELGQLQVNGESASVCIASQPLGPTLDVDVSGAGGGTVIRFRDSRDVPWSGTGLSIRNWRPSTNGFPSDHLFIGTNSQGITAAQLRQLAFVNPLGWPPGSYPALILSTGEIVPGVLPPIAFTKTSNMLILSWSGAYELLTASNLAGPYLPVPGASSPSTNLTTDPERFFRLRALGP